MRGDVRVGDIVLRTLVRKLKCECLLALNNTVTIVFKTTWRFGVAMKVSTPAGKPALLVTAVHRQCGAFWFWQCILSVAKGLQIGCTIHCGNLESLS